MNKAFVEITYSSDAASFAGYCPGLTMHAEVVEVEAENEYDALKKSKEKFKSRDSHGMTCVRSVRFLRWV